MSIPFSLPPGSATLPLGGIPGFGGPGPQGPLLSGGGLTNNPTLNSLFLTLNTGAQTGFTGNLPLNITAGIPPGTLPPLTPPPPVMPPPGPPTGTPLAPAPEGALPDAPPAGGAPPPAGTPAPGAPLPAEALTIPVLNAAAPPALTPAAGPSPSPLQALAPMLQILLQLLLTLQTAPPAVDPQKALLEKKVTELENKLNAPPAKEEKAKEEKEADKPKENKEPAKDKEPEKKDENPAKTFFDSPKGKELVKNIVNSFFPK